ncbi:large ribosomal subunit protein mL64-like [Littorina saxatilis]|uniref:Large ribosomal subunit protein mL64 n=1 Tax=Littorina saxatilis TaxID=31220 RepID=A0AAN9B8E6_9CAEN
MAASMTRAVTFTTCHCRKYFAANICKSTPASWTLQRLSSTSTSNQESDAESLVANYEEMEEEERIEKLRNISGLTVRQNRKLHGQPLEIANDDHKTVRYHRKLYGKLGSASGVDPRLSWTGRKKALELAQLYREWEPSLEERMSKLKMQKEEEGKKIEEREKRIGQNMSKMDQWIEEYKKRLTQKEAEAQKKEDKKRKILEEAREYFGYYVDPRDAKFQEMLEEKERQDKLVAKKQKKEKRMEKLAARLQHMARDSAGDKKESAGENKQSLSEKKEPSAEKEQLAAGKSDS